jgi:Ohr subfamily peroxiredoxin
MKPTLTPIDRVVYTAKAHTTGGREGGASRTSDGRLNVKLSTPGTKGEGTNPEQLFAVGWSSCFLSAIKIEAAAMKIKLSPDATVDAEVDLGATDGQYFLQARLHVNIPGVDRNTGEKLIEGAHRRCPYSKAVHGNISVETSLIEPAIATAVE